jgi:hypothetical protein
LNGVELGEELLIPVGGVHIEQGMALALQIRKLHVASVGLAAVDGGSQASTECLPERASVMP